MKIALLAAILLAPAARAEFKVPGYELVYSYPVETTLEEPDLRQAKDVWPEMFDAARNTIDVNEFYVDLYIPWIGMGMGEGEYGLSSARTTAIRKELHTRSLRTSP